MDAQTAPAPGEKRLNLSAIRRNRGRSLHEIADETKIGTRYLEAIEAEQFEWLPGLIYSTNYIRQYARAIDYDEEAILALYNEAIRETTETSAAQLPPDPPPSFSRRCWRAITDLFRGSESVPVEGAPPHRDMRTQSFSGSSEWLLLQYAEIDRKFRVSRPDGGMRVRR